MQRVPSSTPERRQIVRCNADLPANIEMICRPDAACTVTDISLSGAMLKIDRRIYLTGRFLLAIDGGPEIDCLLKHRLGDRAGVAFVVPLEALP
ncbi:MAG: hypothetical protein ABL904_01100 [Hyphomicrobiaceae bacterium]